ncbi:YcxB family protein [Alkalibaculum sp. M08DMB]|uniref:YcxB family protein n=1 Tax=Alkalibaculum sporogenes TaxID=2655001 RepID=A0A6A7KA02_9FIRM|nr:YcxB family protein [Alkalibaculum sporogenes]
MEIEFEITEDDYIKFNLYHIENSPSQKKTYNFLRYAIPLLFSIPIYAIGTSLFKQPSSYWIIISILFALIWVITYPNQYKKLVRKQTKKILQEGDTSIFGKKTMLIDDNNIKVFSEFTSKTISKKSIKTIKVYDDMILIYLSGFTAQIIPTRYLNDESNKYLMKELIIINII